MPDLKSELMKLENLTFDDDVSSEPAPITFTEPIMNFTKTIWEAVKANPNVNSQQVADLVNNGEPLGISTRLKQMVDRGTLTRTTDSNNKFVYQAVGDAYLNMSKAEILAKAQEARRINRAKREKQKMYNAAYKAKKQAQVVEAPALPPTSLSKNPNAEQLVNSMSVGLAKAVYLELKKVFEA
jgi:hypothetical protein